MIWVVQENLWKEKEYREFLCIIERSGIEYKSVTIIPFSHEITPIITYPGKKIAYGSTTLMKYTIKEKWDPGCYYNEYFDMRHLLKNYKEHMLSNGATICKFKDVDYNLPEFFIRTCEELKQYTGEVIKKINFKNVEIKYCLYKVG